MYAKTLLTKSLKAPCTHAHTMAAIFRLSIKYNILCTVWTGVVVANLAYRFCHRLLDKSVTSRQMILRVNAFNRFYTTVAWHTDDRSNAQTKHAKKNNALQTTKKVHIVHTVRLNAEPHSSRWSPSLTGATVQRAFYTWFEQQPLPWLCWQIV
jgi:hypothetical protein